MVNKIMNQVDTCRICFSGSCYKNINNDYAYRGELENYGRMIHETFNLTLKSNRSLICEPCVTKLRDATVFRQKVLDSETYLAETNELTVEKFETNAPDLKLIQKSETTRKRALPKPVAIKHKRKKDLDKTQRTTKFSKNKYEIVCKSKIKRINSIKLISNSSIWVFNWREGRYRCFCCNEPFSEKDLLQQHTKTHNIEEIASKIKISENRLVKVEVTEITCNICRENLPNLPSLIDHLNNHNIVVTDHLLVPIKINELNCQICQEKHTNFHSLYVHMIRHYQTFICDQCGSGFYRIYYLKKHVTNKHSSSPIKAKRRDEFKCNYCSQRFKQFHKRIEHMVEKHGLKRPEFPCNLCTKVYITKGILNAHIKNAHNVKDRVYECDVCLKTFCMKATLTRHKDTHTEGMNYFCSICNHGFKLVTSLGRHMRQKHK